MAGTTQLRISLTISGAVALGAYEGGALAALLHAVRPLVGGDDAPVRLDAIGAASAGSITGMLAARTLVEGLDPVEVMRGAWVNADGIGNLRARDAAAPLSVQKMRRMATSLMDPPGPRSDARQQTPVQVSFTLATLRGLFPQEIDRRLAGGVLAVLGVAGASVFVLGPGTYSQLALPGQAIALVVALYVFAAMLRAQPRSKISAIPNVASRSPANAAASRASSCRMMVVPSRQVECSAKIAMSALFKASLAKHLLRNYD